MPTEPSDAPVPGHIPVPDGADDPAYRDEQDDLDDLDDLPGPGGFAGIPDPGPLEAWFRRAQRIGLVGNVPVVDHIEHGLRYLDALPAPTTGSPGPRVVDVGTGAGLPGLVLAWARTDLAVELLDAKARSIEALQGAIVELGLTDRVTVRQARAEDHGRGDLRETYDVAVARSLGPPPEVAELLAPLVRVGGRVVVSEPPGSTGARWAVDEVPGLGLAATPAPRGLVAFVKVAATDDALPRPARLRTRQPLW